jgi:hypothetical protein
MTIISPKPRTTLTLAWSPTRGFLGMTYILSKLVQIGLVKLIRIAEFMKNLCYMRSIVDGFTERYRIHLLREKQDAFSLSL